MKIPELASSPAMRRILGVLEKKSNMSISDLSAEAFVGVSTLACGGYIATLKKRQLIYVSGWRKVNRPLLKFEWVRWRDGSIPRQGVKGGRSPAKRTLDALDRDVR